MYPFDIEDIMMAQMAMMPEDPDDPGMFCWEGLMVVGYMIGAIAVTMWFCFSIIK